MLEVGFVDTVPSVLRDFHRITEQGSVRGRTIAGHILREPFGSASQLLVRGYASAELSRRSCPKLSAVGEPCEKVPSLRCRSCCGIAHGHIVPIEVDSAPAPSVLALAGTTADNNARLKEFLRRRCRMLVFSAFTPANPRSNTMKRLSERALPGIVLTLTFLFSADGPVTGQEKSVRPGINKPFENPDVKEFAGKFEVESREIFAKRQDIVTAC